MLQQTLLGFLKHAWVCRPLLCPRTEIGQRLYAPEKLRFSPSLGLLHQGFLFLECSSHGPMYDNSFLFRSDLTITGSEESSKPSQSLSILSPIFLFWPICKNHLSHSEITLLFVYLLINYFFPLEWKFQEGKYLISYTLCTPVPRKVSGLQ